MQYSKSCGLYYKHITIINYDSSVANKFGVSLPDDARVVIYDCHMFIVLATGVFVTVSCFYLSLILAGKAEA